MYAKDLYEVKYQYLINEREGVDINYFNDPKAFIEHSNDSCNVYKGIDDYNPDEENKIIIVFDDVIADMNQNKKLNSIVTDLFISWEKLSISLVFITQSYFKVSKDVRLSTTHFFITQILSNRGLQQIVINYSSGIRN